MNGELVSVKYHVFLVILRLAFSYIRLVSSGSGACAPSCRVREEEMICSGNKTLIYLPVIAACLPRMPAIGVLVLKVDHVHCHCYLYRFASRIIEEKIHLMTTQSFRSCLKKAATLCPSSKGKIETSEITEYEDIGTTADKLSSTSKDLGLSKTDTILGNSDNWVAVQKVTDAPGRQTVYDELKADDFIYIMIIVAAVMAPVVCGLSYVIFYVSRKIRNKTDGEKKRKEGSGSDEKTGILSFFKNKKAKMKKGQDNKSTNNPGGKGSKKTRKSNKKEKEKKKDKKDKTKKEINRKSALAELKKNPGAENKDYISKVNKIFGDDWKDFTSYGPGTFPNISEDGTALPAPDEEQNNSNSLWLETVPSRTGKPQIGDSPVLANRTSNNSTPSAVSGSDTCVLRINSQEVCSSLGPERQLSLSSVNSCLISDERPPDLCTPLLPEKVCLHKFNYPGSSSEKGRSQGNDFPQAASGKVKRHSARYKVQDFSQDDQFSKRVSESLNGDKTDRPPIQKPVHDDLGEHDVIKMAGCEDVAKDGFVDMPLCAVETGYNDTDDRCTRRPVDISSSDDVLEHATINASLISKEPASKSSDCRRVDNVDRLCNEPRKDSLRNANPDYSSPIIARQNRNCSGSVEDTATVVISHEEMKAFFSNCDSAVGSAFGRFHPTDSIPREQSVVTDRGTVVEMDFNRNSIVHILSDQEEMDVDEYSSLLHYSAAD